MKTAKTARRTTTISDWARSTILRADDVDARHREHDQRREQVVPARRRVLADEERRRVAPERDGDHRADDHDRGEVAEPGGDPDQASVAEPLDQVRDDPARRGEADAHLDDGVAEQRGDDPGEEEREPDGRPRDRSGLAEQREDAGADHGADAEEGGAADAHATGRSSAPAVPASGRRRRARRSGSRRARSRPRRSAAAAGTSGRRTRLPSVVVPVWSASAAAICVPLAGKKSTPATAVQNAIM